MISVDSYTSEGKVGGEEGRERLLLAMLAVCTIFRTHPVANIPTATEATT